MPNKDNAKSCYFTIRIPRELLERFTKQSAKNNRERSGQSLAYIEEGISRDEKLALEKTKTIYK